MSFLLVVETRLTDFRPLLSSRFVPSLRGYFLGDDSDLPYRPASRSHRSLGGSIDSRPSSRLLLTNDVGLVRWTPPRESPPLLLTPSGNLCGCHHWLSEPPSGSPARSSRRRRVDSFRRGSKRNDPQASLVSLPLSVSEVDPGD